MQKTAPLRAKTLHKAVAFDVTAHADVVLCFVARSNFKVLLDRSPGLVSHWQPKRSLTLKKTGLLGHHRSMGAVFGIEFAAKRFHMQFDRDFLQLQIAGNFLIGQALAQAA